MEKFRVFVSFSHEDRDLFIKLVKLLENELPVEVLSEKNIGAGTPFTEAIKGLIVHAHVFLPLITNNSKASPWVHQETGYAIARNIPILPVALKGAGLPEQMTSQLQAITVKDDLSDLCDQLTQTVIEDLVLPRPPAPQEMIQVAEWPEQRTEWIANYAKRVFEFGNYGKLRQRGAYSSFCLPDKDIRDSIWKHRDGHQVRSDYYHNLQREERRALEQHARVAGCRLILFPRLNLMTPGEQVRSYRLRTLLEFLDDMPEDKCEVIVSEHALGGNLIIVGDWFVAESLAPRPGGYLQTVFNWHAPTARRMANQFDLQFESLYKQKNLSPYESLCQAKEEIRKVIEEDEIKSKNRNGAELHIEKNC